jgi:hypothetical protein
VQTLSSHAFSYGLVECTKYLFAPPCYRAVLSSGFSLPYRSCAGDAKYIADSMPKLKPLKNHAFQLFLVAYFLCNAAFLCKSLFSVENVLVFKGEFQMIKK